MIRGSSRVMNVQSPLRLYLLGSFRVERDAQTLHLPTRQVESLFAYLALYPEPHAHEKLAALFWDDSRDELAHRSLRAALAAIRKELGDDVLVADRETVRINPGFPLWVDAREIANYELQIADSEIENHPGDLLPDFHDDWIPPERERLRTIYEQIKHAPPENSAARITYLPTPLTSFIGRTKEVATIQELFAKTRLLTLTGSGGCGKTRLAIQVATELANVNRFKKGVAWVEFASLSDASLVPQAIAQSLGMTQVANQPLDETLIDYLRGKQLLLALDNCEHLVAACAQIVDTLLRACPDLKILTTSREALNLAGEITYRVPSLALPDLQNFPSLDILAQCESVRFFIERAVTVCPDFKLTNENARAISQVCHRLDGMPLAIELSAARVKLLTIEQIVARLDDRFRLLTSGNRTALPRQQTLRTAIDWSYDMLSTQEQGLFRCLSVFAGGFTIEAAEMICSNDDLEPAQVLDVMTELVDKSMLIADTTGRAEARYRMLETIREYAHEKSNEVNETQLMRARHLEFYVKLAEEAEPKLKGPEAKDWMDRLEIEYDNIRAVFEYAMTNDVESAVCLAWSLVMLWVRRGYLIEGRNVLTQLLARPEMQGATRVRLQVLKALGYLQVYIQDSVAVRVYFEEGLSIAKILEDETEIAFTLHGMGRAFIFLNDYAVARPLIEESLALYRKIEGRWGEAQSLYSLGAVVYHLGELQSSQALLEESVQVFYAIGDFSDTVWPLTTLGYIAREQGDYARASAFYEKCIEIDKRMDDRIHLGMAILGLGLSVLQQGDYRRAAEIYAEGLEMLKRRGRSVLFVQWLIGTAGVLRGLGKPTVAARLLGAAHVLFASFKAKGIPNTTYSGMYDRISNGVRTELSAETFAQHWQAGRAMDLDQAFEFALTEMKFSDSRDPRASLLSPRQAAKEKFDGLTTREREVAALIARGKSNREIAETLVLSERTIEGHVGNILNKLGFNARTQIAAWAVQKNMLDRAPSTR